MSSRDERRAWEEFREKHGENVRDFKHKWREMFGRDPNFREVKDYQDKRAELTKKLGNKATKADVLITCERHASMGHRLQSYEGLCSSLHGHNIRVAVTVRASMFLDFKSVDADLSVLTNQLDHAMVLHIQDPMFTILQQTPTRLVGMSTEPTTEALAQLVWNHMSRFYTLESVTVYETAKYSATVTSKTGVNSSVVIVDTRGME